MEAIDFWPGDEEVDCFFFLAAGVVDGLGVDEDERRFPDLEPEDEDKAPTFSAFGDVTIVPSSQSSSKMSEFIVTALSSLTLLICWKKGEKDIF